MPESDGCLRCGQSLGLVERILEMPPIEVPGKGEMCPDCYRNLGEEYGRYFS